MLRVLPGPGFTFTHNLRDSMQDQKSSDGATRAAQKVCALIQERVGAALDFAKVHGCDVVPTRHDEIAAIIDREKGWILCSERMPEISQIIDVARVGGVVDRVQLQESKRNGCPALFWSSLTGGVPQPQNYYTHWQPRPTPLEES